MDSPQRQPGPPPSQCVELVRDSKPGEVPNYAYSPWLLRKTSIRVESTPNVDFQGDSSIHRVSTSSSTRSDEKRAVRGVLKRLGSNQAKDQRDDWKSISSGTEPTPFGVTVSIEATRPLRPQTSRRQEMKGLEQAASAKRWTGSGRPGEAWGKLIKDPELWDPTGDTLAYFGYQRPQASFRVRATIVEETKSPTLLSKLQEGYKPPNQALPYRRLTSPPLLGSKPLELQKDHLSGPSQMEADDPRSDDRIRHEIYFPVLEKTSRIDVLRHHLTTRNLFAFLLNKPLVGLTYYQALVDLHERLQVYFPRNDTPCAQMIMRYLIRNSLHNVSNDPAAAAGLLAWSEDVEVRWEEGWREGFVHCVGMYGQFRSLPEFRDVSHLTRGLLDRAHLELQARVQVAEGRLSNFDFDEIWASHTSQYPPARASFHRFRRFLQLHYEKAYRIWPPTASQDTGGTWLTRILVSNLQNDFGALYDCYVNRDVVLEESNKDRDARNRTLVCQSSSQVITNDSEPLGLAKLLTSFSQKHAYPFIPYPFPLLPILNQDEKQQNRTLFGSKSKALEKRVNQAYAGASNIKRLVLEVATNSLVIAFQKFEKNDQLEKTDPQEAREGRWILLYGILQVLSTVSVDTPGLWFTGDVSYFLNPRLKGTPPWITETESFFAEASPRESHCWSGGSML